MNFFSAFFTVCLCVLLIHPLKATKRYWLGGSTSWNTTTNWGSSSGAGGPQSVPVAGDTVYFDAGGTGNCTLDANAAMGSLVVEAGYTGTIDLNDFTFVVTGSYNSIAGGTINDSSGNDSIVFNCTDTSYFTGGTIGAKLHCTADLLDLKTTTYNGAVYFEQTGANAWFVNLNGGNKFNGVTTLKVTGSASFVMGANAADSCFSDLYVINAGSGGINFADGDFAHYVGGNAFVTHSSTAAATVRIKFGRGGFGSLKIDGNLTVTHDGSANSLISEIGRDMDLTIDGDLTINNLGTGSVLSDVEVARNNGASHTIGGNVVINNSSVGGTANDVWFPKNGDINITAGTLTILNNSTATNARVILGNTNASSLIVTGNTTITNSGAGTQKQVLVANSGDLTFNGTVDMVNNSTATNSAIKVSVNSAASCAFNENVTIKSLNASSDGLLVGNGGSGGGTTTLASGKTFSIPGGTADFVGGDLHLKNFSQTGGTQAITMAIDATAGLVSIIDCTWEGNVDFRGPGMYLEGSTYNGTAVLEQNGASDNNSLGGNTFNDDATLRVTGAGNFMTANTSANDFNGNVTYVKSGAGLMLPTDNVTSTYAGNITVDATTAVTFGSSAAGRVHMDGSTAQSINVNGATPEPIFRDLQINNGSDDITLNTPIKVSTELDLDAGHLITTSTNILTLTGATVSSYSESSFVAGPMSKIGSDAFTFPVGKNDTALAEIGISAPLNATDTFTAEYFQTNPNGAGYTVTSKDGSIDHVSTAEYWILDRGVGGSDVSVTLSWDDRSNGVTDLSDLIVARWDGSQWKDHGTDGAPTGNTTAGTVTTSADVTSFSPFTLGSTTTDNPLLPVEFLHFDAYANNGVVYIDWATATEINNDYFTIERSIDGDNWEEVMEVDGAGNSHQILNYFETDTDPIVNVVSYYRLKQTDYDGKFSYSNMVPVKVVEAGDFSGVLNLFPNPAKSGSDVQLVFEDGLTPESLLVVMKDVKGREFYSKVVVTLEENRLIALPLKNDLPAGVYIITATSEDRTYNQKLVVR